MPKSVETTQAEKVTILWNQQVRTDRSITNNKPDIIIRDNEKRTCILIDVAISADSNVIKKEVENNRNSPYVECENNGDTSNNWSNQHHLEMV